VVGDSPAAAGRRRRRRRRKSQQTPACCCTVQTTPGVSLPSVQLSLESRPGCQASLFLACFGLKVKRMLVKYAVLTALENLHSSAA